MRSRSRLLSIGLLALLCLALPAICIAASPHVGWGGSAQPPAGPRAQVVLPGGPAVAAPALVPGASVLTVGVADSYAYASSAGATVVYVNAGAGQYSYNSGGGGLLTALPLPAGATIWQVDAYGYRMTAGTQWWYLDDENTMAGGTQSTVEATSPSGTGLLQTTMTFASGLTLAVGHHWVVSLWPNSSTSGYVGAIVQYTLPTLSFVPLTPTRILDSRNGTGLSGPFSSHVARTFQVTGGGGVPAGARAVTGNLTVTQQTSLGFLFMGPIAMDNPTSSTLNFPAGDDRANGVTVALGAGGTLSVTYAAPILGPTAHVIFDVTGYYR
ncbi:MAG: hypothetical protein ABSE70_09980 [Candidatus Limnocylindrales bacterium]